MNERLTQTQIDALAEQYRRAKATEDKGFQTGDLPMEAVGHGQAQGIRDALAIVLGVEPADVVEMLNAA